MILGLDPKVDYAFKHLFGREETKPILINLLDSVLNPAPGHPAGGVRARRCCGQLLQLSQRPAVLGNRANVGRAALVGDRRHGQLPAVAFRPDPLALRNED